jgi:hypothetical protein
MVRRDGPERCLFLPCPWSSDRPERARRQEAASVRSARGLPPCPIAPTSPASPGRGTLAHLQPIFSKTSLGLGPGHAWRRSSSWRAYRSADEPNERGVERTPDLGRLVVMCCAIPVQTRQSYGRGRSRERQTGRHFHDLRIASTPPATPHDARSVISARLPGDNGVAIMATWGSSSPLGRHTPPWRRRPSSSRLRRWVLR